jgi:hypothetical protein
MKAGTRAERANQVWHDRTLRSNPEIQPQQTLMCSREWQIAAADDRRCEPRARQQASADQGKRPKPLRRLAAVALQQPAEPLLTTNIAEQAKTWHHCGHPAVVARPIFATGLPLRRRPATLGCRRPPVSTPRPAELRRDLIATTPATPSRAASTPTARGTLSPMTRLAIGRRCRTELGCIPTLTMPTIALSRWVDLGA